MDSTIPPTTQALAEAQLLREVPGGPMVAFLSLAPVTAHRGLLPIVARVAILPAPGFDDCIPDSIAEYLIGGEGLDDRPIVIDAKEHWIAALHNL